MEQTVLKQTSLWAECVRAIGYILGGLLPVVVGYKLYKRGKK